MTGVIKKLVADKGFGFITPDGETEDLFFHSSALVGATFNDVHEGDKVTFEKTMDEKRNKMNATSVSKA